MPLFPTQNQQNEMMVNGKNRMRDQSRLFGEVKPKIQIPLLNTWVPSCIPIRQTPRSLSDFRLLMQPMP